MIVSVPPYEVNVGDKIAPSVNVIFAGIGGTFFSHDASATTASSIDNSSFLILKFINYLCPREVPISPGLWCLLFL